MVARSFGDGALPGREAPPCARVLIADDQPDVLVALRLLLKREGFETETASSQAEVLARLETGRFDALLMDLNYTRDTTSGEEGLSLLRAVRRLDHALPVIALTGWATLDVVVETLREGVSDFIQKPWDNEKLLTVLRTQVARSRLLQEDRRREAEAAHEIEEAREVQRGFVPQEISPIPGCRLAVAWRPSGALSGDYFDVLPFGEGSFGICIADVAGKGMPAALLMSTLQASVRGLAGERLSPESLCRQLNTLVYQTITENKFITFFYGLLQSPDRTLRYANAGHCPPILVRRSGAVTRLREGGAVLGVYPEWRYEQGEVALAAGDRLLLFTDGISEALAPDGEEYGEDRLIEMARSDAGGDPEELQRSIMRSVGEFRGGPLADDATLMVIQVA